jgi:signal transduction histidine kinase
MRLRLKIALLSLVISGSILVGFGICFLGVISRVQMDRADREIAALCNGPLQRRLPRMFWEDFGKSLQIVHGENQSNQLVACVWDSENKLFYKPAQCPPEIATMRLPTLKFAESQPPESARQDDGGPRFPDSEGPSDKGLQQVIWPGGPWMLAPPPPDQSGLSNAPGMMRWWPDGSRGMPGLRAARVKKPVFQTVNTSGGDWRVGILGNDSVTIVIGVNLAEYHREAARIRNAFLFVVPLGLLVLAGGGWLLAARALRPIAIITHTAAGITARGLDKRVPFTSADPDLVLLSEVINGMLCRLERSFGQAVRFSADAAHELQTPLTVLQGELEEAVQCSVPGSDEQQRYSGLLEEAQRLKAIVQKLLLLARADAGQLTLQRETVDLTALVESAVEDVKAIGPELLVEQQIASGVHVKADTDLLAQVIRNMTSNAVKYNVEHGWVVFQLCTNGRVAQFTLSNTGVPIPPEDQERIFDRFYRVDKSRSRRIGGVGLGLSIAREIARVHHGDLVFGPPREEWISFTLTIPLEDVTSPP